MKICLALKHASAAFTPLPLMCLKAALIDLGGWRDADVPLAEFKPDASVDDMVAGMLAAEPDVLALSCYVWNVASLLEAGRRVKAQRPNLRVVLGGPEVGPQAAEVLAAHPWVDAIVKNEGELPMVDLADRWRSGAAIDDVDGIVIHAGERIVDTGPERFVRDINNLPTAYRDFGSYSYKGKYACIETQRGCVFTCNFCFFNKDLPIRNRRFDAGRVDREITYLLQQDINHLYFMDPIEGRDRAGNRIAPDFAVDVTHYFDKKRDMLAAHVSQRSWVLKQHGIDDYMGSMEKWTAKRGLMFGVAFAEGFQQYSGTPYPRTKLLQELVGGALLLP